MIYWLIFFGIFIANIKLRKEASFYLWAGFFLFLAGSILSLLGIFNLSELLFRLCLVLLSVGFIFSIIRYFKR